MNWNWEQAQAPDVVGRILACRLWTPGETNSWSRPISPELRSTGVNYSWVGAGPHRAVCLSDGQTVRHYCQRSARIEGLIAAASRIESPSRFPPVVQRQCGCGFWGLNSWDNLAAEFSLNHYQMLGSGISVIVGLVEMWGRVVPGRYGWRAEYAQITALSHAESASLFGVPHLVSLDNSVLTPPFRHRQEAS